MKHEDLKKEENWWEKKDSNYADFEDNQKKQKETENELAEIQKKMQELEAREAEAKKLAEKARNDVEKTE